MSRRSIKERPDAVEVAAERFLTEVKTPVDNKIAVRVAEDIVRFLNLLSTERGDISGVIDTVEERTVKGKLQIREREYEITITQGQLDRDRHKIYIGCEMAYPFSAEFHAAEDLWAERDWRVLSPERTLTEFLIQTYTDDVPGFQRPATIPKIDLTIGQNSRPALPSA